MDPPVSTIIDYATPRPAKRHAPLLMLAVSLAMAFVLAITFVVVLTLTLPPTDGAYGQAPFHDPLVLPVMSMGASVAGLVVFPFFYFAIRCRPLGKSVAIVMSSVLVEIVILTPISAGLGFVGTFAAFAIAVMAARKLSSVPPLVG